MSRIYNQMSLLQHFIWLLVISLVSDKFAVWHNARLPWTSCELVVMGGASLQLHQFRVNPFSTRCLHVAGLGLGLGLGLVSSDRVSDSFL